MARGLARAFEAAVCWLLADSGIYAPAFEQTVI